MACGRRGALLAIVPLLLCSGCIFTRDAVAPLTAAVPEGKKELRVKRSAKAHLDDGSVILFDQGFTLQGDVLRGPGEQYDLTRSRRTLVAEIPLARVAALEKYERGIRPVATVAGVFLGGPLAVVGTVYLFKLLFGSCPTVYSPDAGGGVLEAELFSHSITRGFEGADLDRIEAARPVDGTLRLRVANEALETHYLNRLELVAADHPDGYEAFPTPAGSVALLGAPTPLRDARSRAGRDAGAAIASRDGVWYQTGPDLDREAAERPTDDWVEGVVEVPPGAATVTVALRLRNTLLDTVLLYDVLLRSQGVGALAWMDRFDRNPLAAWRFHAWFADRFALRVLLEEDGGFREVARIPVTGPIAWHETAVSFAAPAPGRARLRFASLADNWQFDWVGVSLEAAPRPRVSRVPVAAIAGPEGADAPAALRALARGDDRYLVTTPGQSYTLSFPAGAAPDGLRRTWLLSSRGYYIEWLRGSWLVADAAAPGSAPRPDDAAIVSASRRWAERRESFEREFFSTRIPTGARQ